LERNVAIFIAKATGTNDPSFFERGITNRWRGSWRKRITNGGDDTLRLRGIIKRKINRMGGAWPLGEASTYSLGILRYRNLNRFFIPMKRIRKSKFIEQLFMLRTISSIYPSLNSDNSLSLFSISCGHIKTKLII